MYVVSSSSSRVYTFDMYVLYVGMWMHMSTNKRRLHIVILGLNQARMRKRRVGHNQLVWVKSCRKKTVRGSSEVLAFEITIYEYYKYT